MKGLTRQVIDLVRLWEHCGEGGKDKVIDQYLHGDFPARPDGDKDPIGATMHDALVKKINAHINNAGTVDDDNEPIRATAHDVKYINLCNAWGNMSEAEKNEVMERWMDGTVRYVGAKQSVKSRWDEIAEQLQTRRAQLIERLEHSTSADEWANVWLTTKETARLLGVFPAEVRDMVKSGELAADNPGGKWHISARDVWERVHPASLPQRTVKPKGQTEASPEEQAERASEMRTQGRKGCKAVRINMAFAPENHEFIKVMARASGRTMTEFANLVIGAYRKEHPELMAAASTFLDVINSGTFSALPADEPDEDEPEAIEPETLYEQTTLPTNAGNACAAEAPTERQRKFIWCIEQILPVRFCGETRYDAWLWIRNHISEFKAASDESKER